MSISKSTRKYVAIGVIAAVLGAAVVVYFAVRPQSAEAETTANCSGAGAYAELAVEREDGGIEVSAELAGARPGETWEVSLQRGEQVLLESTRTADEEGELDVDAFTDDGSSTDTYTFETTNQDGTTCRASVNH